MSSLLSFRKKTGELASKLNASWEFTLETCVELLQRFPILTNIVLYAELDILWHSVKKRKNYRSLSIQNLKANSVTDLDFLLTASISEWDHDEGFLLLTQDCQSIKQYLLPSQIEFYSVFSDSLKAVTCIPEHFYPDICALLPTYSIIFHSSDTLKHSQFIWFSFIEVEDSPSDCCIVTLKPIVDSLHSKSLRIQSNRKKLFHFFSLGSIIGLFNFEASSSSPITLTEKTIIAMVDIKKKEPCDLIEPGENFSINDCSRIENFDTSSNNSRFSILGTFIGISDHKTYVVDGIIQTCIKVEIDDHSGIKQIESHGTLSKEFLHLFPGQVVLLSNLSNSTQNLKGEVLFYALPKHQAKITVISSLQTFLTSESVLCLSKLSSIDTPSFQISEISISAHSLPPFCELAHSICQRPLILKASFWNCPFCKVDIEPNLTKQTLMVYSIVWSISDDSKTLDCEALSRVSSKIIGANAEEFNSFSLDKQKMLIGKVLQKRYRVGIVSYYNHENKSHSLQFRLDMVTEIANC